VTERRNSRERAEALFAENQGLVRWIVRQKRFGDLFRQHRMDVDDALQVASMGLWHACQRFDASRGIKLSSYAVHCARGFLLTALKLQRFGVANPVDGGIDLTRFQLVGERRDLDRAAGDETLDDAVRAEQVAAVRAAVASLPGRLARIMQMHMADATLDQIGAEFGFTRERARQLVVKAKDRLRRLLSRHHEEGDAFDAA
jgi:RNA polymerase sigma factor (sigma-70 family)